jgi:hypothetical protein
MKLTVTILGCLLAAGLASAQSPSVIQNTRSTMNGVSSNSASASNQALGTQSSAAPVSSTHNAATLNGVAAVSPVRPSSPAVKQKAGKKGAPGVVAVPQKSPMAPVASSGGKIEESATADPKLSANGKRDPFISPVVSHAGGSGCSTGKKCLEIGAINLRGVVHSDNGFIAVVSNDLNKAYFLRENDPVFNGFVVKITGDSIVFQETLQDRLGKTFTREVVKKITTPAV